MSDSLLSHGLQPASLLCPWGSLGKNTGVIAIPFSKGSSWHRDWIWVSCIASRFFTVGPTCEAIQLLNCVRFFATPETAAYPSSLSITVSWSLSKFIPIESVRPSNHLILYCPLLLLPSIFPSIKVFSNESTLRIRWPKYWSFSFSISLSNEYSGLISFRIDWLDLFAVQRTLKSLLQ